MEDVGRDTRGGEVRWDQKHWIVADKEEGSVIQYIL